jgi:hypothetical protein
MRNRQGGVGVPSVKPYEAVRCQPSSGENMKRRTVWVTLAVALTMIVGFSLSIPQQESATTPQQCPYSRAKPSQAGPDTGCPNPGGTSCPYSRYAPTGRNTEPKNI